MYQKCDAFDSDCYHNKIMQKYIYHKSTAQDELKAATTFPL